MILKTKLLKISLFILIISIQFLWLKIALDLKIDNAVMRQNVIEYSNQIKEANERIRVVEETKNKELTVVHCDMAVVYVRNKLYEEAIWEYEKIFALVPNDSNNYNIYYNIGVIYDEFLNMPTKALLYYNKFLELAPLDDHRRPTKINPK